MLEKMDMADEKERERRRDKFTKENANLAQHFHVSFLWCVLAIVDCLLAYHRECSSARGETPGCQYQEGCCT